MKLIKDHGHHAARSARGHHAVGVERRLDAGHEIEALRVARYERRHAIDSDAIGSEARAGHAAPERLLGALGADGITSSKARTCRGENGITLTRDWYLEKVQVANIC